MKSFVKIAHWQGYVTHIEKDYFIANVTYIPLDKKKARLNKEKADNDGIVEMQISEIPKKDQHKIQLGKIFDWYIGYTSKPYQKRRVDVSVVEWMKKYGKDGKRINKEKVKREAAEMYKNLKWD